MFCELVRVGIGLILCMYDLLPFNKQYLNSADCLEHKWEDYRMYYEYS